MQPFLTCELLRQIQIGANNQQIRVWSEVDTNISVWNGSFNFTASKTGMHSKFNVEACFRTTTSHKTGDDGTQD